MTEAVQAVETGDPQKAYVLFQRINRLDPELADAWLWRGFISKNYAEALACISKALHLEPDNQRARALIYSALKKHLEEDPILRYVKENDRFYVVQTADERHVTIPKERTRPSPYPLPSGSPVRHANRMLWLSLAGLILAGFGGMAGALVTLGIARFHLGKPLTDRDRGRLVSVQWLAAGIFLAGALIGLIFLLHI